MTKQVGFPGEESQSSFGGVLQTLGGITQKKLHSRDKGMPLLTAKVKASLRTLVRLLITRGLGKHL